jgi:hypothetical protein
MDLGMDIALEGGKNGCVEREDIKRHLYEVCHDSYLPTLLNILSTRPSRPRAFRMETS